MKWRFADPHGITSIFFHLASRNAKLGAFSTSEIFKNYYKYSAHKIN